MSSAALAVTAPLSVPIELGDRSYSILIGAPLIDEPASYEGLPKSAHALIVTNDTVAPLYLSRLQAQLQGRHRQVHTVVLPDGEAHKEWGTLQRIFDALLSAGCDRK